MILLRKILELLNLFPAEPQISGRPKRRSSEDVFQLFGSYFGFNRSFVEVEDFRDEMVITIMTYSLKARELARKRLENPFLDDLKEEYICAIRNYHHVAELAYTVHPDFENIPLRWSRFPEFFEQWTRRRRPSRQDSTAIDEEALLLTN